MPCRLVVAVAAATAARAALGVGFGGPDAALQTLFLPSPPWLGADCATSIPVDGDRYLWIFQDTVVGTMTADGRQKACATHNSVGVSFRRVDRPLMNRGDAAAATWIFRGDESTPRLRRGYSVETSRGAPPRPRRGYCLETSRGCDVDIPWRQIARLRYRVDDGQPATTLAHGLRGDCAGGNGTGFFDPPNASEWYWPENGLVVGDRAYVFAQTMTLPCGVGCTQKGVGLIEVSGIASPDALLWDYRTMELRAGRADRRGSRRRRGREPDRETLPIRPRTIHVAPRGGAATHPQ